MGISFIAVVYDYLKTGCSMADGISFDVSLSLNCTDFCLETLEVLRIWSVCLTSLIIHRKWLLHHQKVTRVSCNLNIGMEHKHTVQTQIRLLHLINNLHNKPFCHFKQAQKKIG